MAFVAVDQDGAEYIYSYIQLRLDKKWSCVGFGSSYVFIPSGTIKKLIGFDLKWEDDPIELT